MSQTSRRNAILRITESLYLLFLAISFYLLILSRTGEAQTIWQVLHPAFLPTLFVSAFLLFVILFSSEKTESKLFLVILYSILIHSFFSVIFPVGDLSGQQMILGRTRRVFDNTILHGLSGWPNRSIEIFIVEALKGTNLQAAESTIFARMLSTDILNVHLFLVPVLWGIFVPIGSFLLTKTIGGNEKTSVLASLLISAFPFSTYFGAISVPNSLGFIFFLFSMYFIVKYVSSQDSKTRYLMLIFSFFSFFAHFLTGFMSLSFLLLAVAFKTYKSEREVPTWTSKILVAVAFLVCLGLLPLAFVYLRFVGSSSYGIFTLDNFYELPLGKLVGLFLIGELIYGFDLQTIVLMMVGPLLAFSYMVYLLFKSRRNPSAKLRPEILFLILAFLVIVIDYRILKLFMEGLPLNVERLWVIRDLIVSPFVALAIVGVVSALANVKTTSSLTRFVPNLIESSKGNGLRILTLVFVINILVPAVLGGWVVFSLRAAYPQVAPLQTTWYELDAVRYIKNNTPEKYVVVCDVWTVYAGEVIVGISNPSAYYFAESSRLGHDLFVNMTKNPSPEWMLSAMNQTKTQVAYFVITEPRVGTEEFNDVLIRVQEQPLTLFYISQNAELYVFSYKNSTQS